MNIEFLTYSRAEGLPAGMSLAGVAAEEDKDGNKALYGKDETTKQIIAHEDAPNSAKALIRVLDKASPAGS